MGSPCQANTLGVRTFSHSPLRPNRHYPLQKVPTGPLGHGQVDSWARGGQEVDSRPENQEHKGPKARICRSLEDPERMLYPSPANRTPSLL